MVDCGALGPLAGVLNVDTVRPHHHRLCGARLSVFGRREQTEPEGVVPKRSRGAAGWWWRNADGGEDHGQGHGGDRDG